MNKMDLFMKIYLLDDTQCDRGTTMNTVLQVEICVNKNV